MGSTKDFDILVKSNLLKSFKIQEAISLLLIFSYLYIIKTILGTSIGWIPVLLASIVGIFIEYKVKIYAASKAGRDVRAVIKLPYIAGIATFIRWAVIIPLTLGILLLFMDSITFSAYFKSGILAVIIGAMSVPLVSHTDRFFLFSLDFPPIKCKKNVKKTISFGNSLILTFILYALFPACVSLLYKADSLLSGTILALTYLTVPTVMGYFISSRVNLTLKRASKSMDKLASGEEYKETNCITIDDLSVLTTGITRISNKRNEYISMIKQIERGDLQITLSDDAREDILGKELLNFASRYNTLFKQIISGSNKVQETSSLLDNQTSSIASYSDLYASNVNELKDTVDGLEKQNKTNNEKLQSSNQQVKEIMNAAEEGTAKMAEMTSAMHDISNSSKDIGQILKTIEDIAFQTNLLALNASVEAARAGQHGRGFAVVAEEVRELANRSSQSVQDSSALVEKALENIKKGSRVVGDIESTFEEITYNLEELVEHFDENEEVNKAQHEGILKMINSIDQVDRATQEDDSKSRDISEKASLIFNAALSISKLIQGFKVEESEEADSTDSGSDEPDKPTDEPNKPAIEVTQPASKGDTSPDTVEEKEKDQSDYGKY